jgi:phosphoribosylglycinamide formyltransferase-1
VPVCDPIRIDLRGVILSARLVVLVSGSGSNLAAILEAAQDPAYGATVVAVGADRDDIEGLRRAERAGVPTFVCRVPDFANRDDWDAALTEAVAAYDPSFVVSAGFMKILGSRFLDRFTTINTHPALLPAFPGGHAVRDALAYGVKVTGATVHFVDAGVDTGPVIAQVAVPVAEGDDESSLHERIKQAEREMVVDVVRRMAQGAIPYGKVQV